MAEPTSDIRTVRYHELVFGLDGNCGMVCMLLDKRRGEGDEEEVSNEQFELEGDPIEHGALVERFGEAAMEQFVQDARERAE